MRKVSRFARHGRSLGLQRIIQARRRSMNNRPKFGIIQNASPIIIEAGRPFRKITDKHIVTTMSGQVVSL